MAFGNEKQVACTNKLCDYRGTVTLWNNRPFGAKRTCPKCGFKTLDEAFYVLIPRIIK